MKDTPLVLIVVVFILASVAITYLYPLEAYAPVISTSNFQWNVPIQNEK